MDAIKVILGIIFGLIMLGWIVTVIVMACGPWVAVVIAAIALTIYLNRDWLRLHSNNSSLTYWHDKMTETPDKMSCCDWSRGWSDRCKSLIITPFIHPLLFLKLSICQTNFLHVKYLLFSHSESYSSTIIISITILKFKQSLLVILVIL